MMKKYKSYTEEDISKVFDDYVVEDSRNLWAPICEDCSKKHGATEDIPINGEICGVKGCNNPAKYYIDFHLKH